MRHLLFAALAGATVAVAAPAGATLIGAYELNGSLADSVGAGTLSYTAGTPTYTAGGTGIGITFPQGDGLQTASYNGLGTYSIETYFSFDKVTGFNRIIDFLNQTSDTGLYVLNGALNFYNITTGPASAFTPGAPAHVVVTRDGATGAFTGYVNGAAAISFVDSSNLALITGGLTFYRDDGAVSGEQSAGFADFVHVYDTVLSAAEVGSLYDNLPAAAVPESATWGMMILGFGLMGGAMRRRVRRSEVRFDERIRGIEAGVIA